jgi:hypothetical protein
MSTDGCGTKLAVWEAAQNGTDEGPGKWFFGLVLFLLEVFVLFCVCF